MSDDHDFDFEPLPGLPAPLPAGERVLWRGAPEPWRFAARALRLSWIGGYFALLAGWQLASAVAGNANTGELVGIVTSSLTMALVTCAILAAAGWLIAINTVYTITSERVIFRHGVAMPMAINIPFARIDGAEYRAFEDGTGDLALALAPGDTIYRLLLWPHARPGRYLTTMPMLRTVKDGAKVATILSEALAANASAAPVRAARPSSDRERPGATGPTNKPAAVRHQPAANHAIPDGTVTT